MALGSAPAQVAAARDDHDQVLTALQPLLHTGPRHRVDQAEFPPANPEAVPGQIPLVDAAFRRGLSALEGFALPMRWALLELAHGQMLRRAGQRRAAAKRLRAARDLFAGLGDRPQLELCDRELAACGLTPTKRAAADPRRLTPQESAVARLVAQGMGNRQVAGELFVSIKTVQFHLTHIYSKFGINNRAELAAHFRDTDTDDACPSPSSRFAENRSPGPPARSYPEQRGGQTEARSHSSHPTKRSNLDPRRLTPQESAVARLVAQGMGTRQVAGELFVSIKTVQFHLTHIYSKFGINNRAELAAHFDTS